MRKYIFSLVLLLFVFVTTVSAHDPDKKSTEPLEINKETLLPKPAEIFEMNKDRFAIVNFTITKIELQQQPQGRMPGRPPVPPGTPPQRIEKKIPVTLSAFFIDDKGTLITSGLAADKPIVPGTIKVVVNGKGTYSADYLGKHQTLNVCYFKVNFPANTKINFVEFTPDILSIGDQVLVISHYGGIFNYMPRFSVERFNGIMKNTHNQTVMLFDATEAKVNGMLNGIVFNRQGHAVGLVVLNSLFGAGRKVSQYYSVSLALDVIKATKEIPKPAPKAVATQPKEPPKTVWFGIKMQPMTPELAQMMSKPEMTGVVVTYVVPGAPADKAGILPGDVITQIGSKKVDCPNNASIYDLSNWIKTLPVRTDPLYVYRDGKDLKLSIKFAIRDDRKTTMQRYADPHYGFSVEEMSRQQLDNTGVTNQSGVMVKDVTNASLAHIGELAPNCAILEVNGNKIKDFEHFKLLLQEAKKTEKDGVLILIKYPFGTRYINIGPQF